MIVPDQMQTTLAYGDVWDFAGGATPLAFNMFRLNSCFDPDGTGVGGTPSGFANWCGLGKFYARYSVKAVDMTVSFVPTHASQTGLVGILYGSGTAASFPTTAVEYQQCALEGDTGSFKVLPPVDVGTMQTVRCKMDISQILAGAVDGNTAYYNANPALSAQAVAFIVNADGATAGITCRAIVRIKYTVVFSDRAAQYVD